MVSDASTGTKVPKASDVLANLLKVRILSEGLEPGERLPSEAELIEQYKFSRGTVREALRMLESDGIVAVRRGPRGGIEVSAPDVTQVTRSMAVLFAFDGTPVSDLVNFRLVIEPGAAAMAARNATAAQKAQLMAATEIPEIGAEMLPHSVEFHRLLGQATNNGFMITILTAMNEVLEWQTTRQELSSKDQAQTGHAHRAIAEAINAGDEEKAAHDMRLHLEKFRDVLRKQGRLSQPVVPRPNGNSPVQNAAWY